MAWLKVEVQTPDKPEVFDIADQLGIDPDAAFGKCFRIWSWFDAHTTNGKPNGVGVSDSLLDRVAGVSGFAKAMYSAGWLEYDGECYGMVNFDVHNGESAKQRAMTAKRVAKHSQKTNAKPNAISVSPALAREEKIREEVNIEPLSDSQANTDPVPSPAEDKKQSLTADAKTVIDFLNLRTGRKYRHTKSNLDPIIARMREGYTLQEIRTVTMRKVNDWLTDEKMSEFLRPLTLYTAKNFNSYAGILE